MLLPANAVAWAVGVAGAATGVVLLLSSKRGGPQAIVAPRVARDGGGLGVSGSFD